MIEYLEGRLHAVEDGHIVLVAGGVGYGLDLPRPALDELPGLGETARLYVSTIVREDDLSLCGFTQRADKAVFDILRHVSGIGPRTALEILSTVQVAELAGAIARGDTKILERVPGIGRKKAERLILELKDRLKRFPVLPEAAAAAAGAESAPRPDRGDDPLYDEAVQALEALGYKPPAAARAVATALREWQGDPPDIENLLREVLRRRL